MDERAYRNLRNVIVFSLVDGDFDEAEKRFIHELRVRLGIDERRFDELCRELRNDRSKLTLPRDPAEARESIELLRQTAEADGRLDERELALLKRLVDHAGLDETVSAGILSEQTGGPDEFEISNMVEDIYEHFHEWTDEQRRAKVGEIAAVGRTAVMPLLRVLESYRVPRDMPNAMGIKTLIAEQLGRLGDKRAVYYLAQQVCLADGDDECSSPALREAAAESIGTIVGAVFGRDPQSVQAVREWWRGEGRAEYNTLAY